MEDSIPRSSSHLLRFLPPVHVKPITDGQRVVQVAMHGWTKYILRLQSLWKFLKALEALGKESQSQSRGALDSKAA